MSREYPATVMTRARELRGYGMTLEAIRDEIEREFGRRPSTNTVKRWTSARERALIYARTNRRRARDRANANSGRLHPRAQPTSEFKLARIASLDALGLSAADIATVMTFDLGDPITRFQVRRAMETGRYPRPRKAAAPAVPRDEDPDVQKWIAEGWITS